MGLRLRVAPVDGSRGASDDVEVIVLLENTDPEESWVLVPRIVVGNDDPLDPTPTLKVRVADPSGAELVAKTAGEPEQRLPTSTCDMTDFAPSMVIGRRVVLTRRPYQFTFAQPGTYVVEASLTSHARAWLKTAKRHDECWKDLDRVFEGTLRSEAIEVKVGPSAASGHWDPRLPR